MRAGLRLVLAGLPWLGCCLPIGLIVIGIQTSGAQVPLQDHWDMIPLLERVHAGTLRFGDLWAQQNEHRYVVPWAVMLVLAWVTRWSLRAELFLNVVFSLASVGVLGALVDRTTRSTSRALVPWLVLAASLMTFSQVKWANWYIGMSQPAFASALAACVAVFVLTRAGASVAGTALAMLAAAAGVLSFGTGFALLGIVPLGLALDPRAALRKRLAFAAAAAAAGVALSIVYLAGFRYPEKHSDPWLIVRQPAAFAAYLLAYLGAPLGWPDVAWSIGWGGVGVLAIGVATVALWPRSAATRANVLPWTLLALWVVASGVMTATGRLGLGVAQAVESRYTTTSTFFWVSVIVIVAFAMPTLLARRSDAPGVVTTVFAIVVVVQMAACASYASVWIRTEHAVEAFTRGHGWLFECVRFYRDAPANCLGMGHHDPAFVRRSAEWLDRAGLGPFRERVRLSPLAAYTVVEPPEPPGAIVGAWKYPIRGIVHTTRVYDGTGVALTGWARHTQKGGVLTGVLVVAGDTILDRVPVGSSGQWVYTFDLFRVPSRSGPLDAYGELDGRRVVRLQGGRPIDGLPRMQ